MNIFSIYKKAFDFLALATENQYKYLKNKTPGQLKNKNKQKYYFDYLKDTLLKISNTLPTIEIAYKIWQAIDNNRQHPSWLGDGYSKELNRYKTALEYLQEFQQKYKLELYPEMPNDLISLFISNLDVLLNSKPFTNYNHHIVGQYGKLPYIDIDEWVREQQSYSPELGF